MAYRAWEDVEVFDVPQELRRPDKGGEYFQTI